jgi:MFS family permease
VVTDPGGAATALDRRRWRGLVVMLLAAFMDIVDTTVVLIAAPTIRTDLGASYADIQWVVAAYALALGLVLVTGGRLGDILGRKRLFLAGVAVFTAASAACALAPVASSRSATCSTRWVLPTPASPPTTTNRGSPTSARPTASSIASSCSRRPTRPRAPTSRPTRPGLTAALLTP